MEWRIWSFAARYVAGPQTSLTADTVVLSISVPAIRYSDKIQQMLTVGQSFDDTLKFRIFVADHNRFCMIQNRINSVNHQTGYVGNAVEDEIAICTNQTCQVHIPIKNAQVIAFADQMLDHFNHRTLSQIIRPGFETEPQNADPSVSLFRYQAQAF